MIRKLLYVLILVSFTSIVGCTGGVSLSVGAGGGFYDTKHPDAANIIRAVPIIETSTKKSWKLPQLKK